ncbi:MAG: hypothetical protein JST39_19670 [Bacteroidetes bacterium]|nr:hypothetical protein [Bacteroidota bacterium]
MRFNRILFILSIPFVLASCMDTREELVIQKDGSGTLAVKADLSKMVEMVKSMANDSDIQKQGLGRAFDTTMLLKSFLDTAQGIPEEEKNLLRDGSLHINLNVKENLGKFEMLLPYSSTDKLPKLYASLNEGAGGLKGMMGKMGGNSGDQGQKNDKGLPQITSVYDITVKKGLFSRKVNKARYESFSQGMKLDQLKQLSGMLGAMSYTFVLTLPQPVKKTSNQKAVLSGDKKTVTLTSDLLECFEHPEMLELEIEY